ncbi:unnamed protein product, partial [Anisakis simplex]
MDYFDYPSLLSAKDIAVFGTFCALATFERSELKEKVLGSVLFRKFLESEPKLVELLQKFCRSEFGTCLDIMEEMRDQLLLNMYLSAHVKEIYYLIRRCAVVQYFTPYQAADIRRMADVFRVSVNELEDELVKLIENDDISARIDSFNKVLYANKRGVTDGSSCSSPSSSSTMPSQVSTSRNMLSRLFGTGGGRVAAAGGGAIGNMSQSAEPDSSNE